MALETLASSIPEAFIGSISILIYIIQALGVLTILYIVFLFVRAFFDRKLQKTIEKISRDVEDIKKLLKNRKK